MMELRQPPTSPTVPPAGGRLVPFLLISNIAALMIIGFLVWRESRGGDDWAFLHREVAAKLQAAGALEEATTQYAAYLREASPEITERARIAYSLGSSALERGQGEVALRWFYEAESLLDLGAADEALRTEVGTKIVHALERLGRHHAAQAALNQQVRMEDSGDGQEPVARSADDPVLAVLDGKEIRRSAVERKLDDLAPQLAGRTLTAEQRAQLLQRFVADELMWRKALKLEYDRDATVLRRQETMLRQLAIDRLLEKEVAEKIAVDDADLQNFYQAHQERYQRPPEKEGAEPQTVPFDQARPAVEQDYRRSKLESAYQTFIEQELSTAAVEMFPERWNG
jgi:hypothetical protein